jgi:hypothetical protein
MLWGDKVMLSDDQDVPKMPESDSPLKPIIDWYNIARERANAPSYRLEAHYFGISLPRLRNIIDVNRLDNSHIELLDKHNIGLNLAAAISQEREHWDEILNDHYLSELSKSTHRLTDLYLTKKGDTVDIEDIMQVFIKEGYCGKVYDSRLKQKGRADRKKQSERFESMLQDILRKIDRGSKPSIKQIQVIFQAINQERDEIDFKRYWTSASTKISCPKSVEMVENWDGN